MDYFKNKYVILCSSGRNYTILKVKNRPDIFFLYGIINFIYASVYEDNYGYLIAWGSQPN